MKKLCILFLVLACAFSTFLACNNTSETSESGQNESSQVLDSEQSNIPDSSITEEITFTISFLPENGTDERLDYEYKAGEQVTIPENSFIYEGYIFIGWENENVVYQAGETFTMPEHNVEMMAKWEAIPEEPSPSFSQSEYEYDKLGGFDLELPLDLDGANLYYVEIDGEIIAPADYSYDEDTKCLVISANIVLALAFETHEIVAITDAETEQPVKCLVTVTQSLKTTFDEETTKDFIYGKDLGVTFAVGYNTTTPIKLMQGEREIDAKYYSYDEKSFTVSAGWLSYFSEPTTYSLHLSNNDVYEFTISTNVIFATDYDISTIHDTTASNIGHNPLYQYYDNVAIVEGPEGMNGKVLKITPNTVDVTYDCNGYLTLRRSDWSVTWKEGGFVQGKYYVISFDYMTESTSVGEFYYGSTENKNARTELLLGTENDGIVRNVTMTISYDEIKTGLFLWAKFIGGGGCVYVDNFRIAQLDEIPTLSANGEYDLVGDYVFNFDSANVAYEVTLDGKEIEAVYDAIAKTLTLPESAISNLKGGTYTLSIKTAVGEFTAQLRVVDNRIATLKDTKVTYVASEQSEIKLYGSFTEGLKINSLKVKDRLYDNGYTGGWDFYHPNNQAEYAKYANIVGGFNDSGYILLASELLDMFWGETQFVAEISNGSAIEFTVVNDEVIFLSNYDSLTMRGIYNGGFSAGSPMSSGMHGSTQIIEERPDGKGNAVYYKGTENSADLAAITFRMNKHVWEWYTVQGDYDHLFRITFDYQIKGFNDKEAYFFFIIPNGEVVENNFFGNYDELVKQADWTEVRYYLNTDGEIHTFDSGWYTWNSVVRNLKIQLPLYSVNDGKHFMLDEVKIEKTDDVLANIGDYQVKQHEEFGVEIGGASVKYVKVDGVDISYEIKGSKVVILNEALDLLSIGTHNLRLETSKASYMRAFSVSDNRISTLTQTETAVIREQGTVKLAGEFSENLNVVSITRYGADIVWDVQPGILNPEYITVEKDGLVLAADLVNLVYKNTDFEVVFDNGKKVYFTLNSNIWYYSDYDEANVFVNIGGNSVIYQDRNMVDVVDAGNGDYALKYTPSTATEWHSTQAINGNGTDNLVFTFVRRNVNGPMWYDIPWGSCDTAYVSFEYDIVVAEGKQSHYQFNWWGMDGSKNVIPLSGSGTFTFIKPAVELKMIGINCPAGTPDEVAGSAMYIDKFAIGWAGDVYLTQHSISVTRGGGAITLPGSFESDLTVTSLARFGNNFWDNSKTNLIEIDSSLVSISEKGLTVSAELIDKVYGEAVFVANLSNGGKVRFSLNSTNSLYYSDFDLFSIHELSQGNIRTCQDSAMWEIVEVEGDKKVKYTPANATLGHAANGAGDNGCFTFSNTSLGNHWWLEYAFDTTRTLVVTFDYSVVLGEGKQNYFLFDAIDGASMHHTSKLEGKGTFTAEIDTSSIVGFRIYCPSGSLDAINGSYMLIDNFCVYYKA